MKSAICLSTLLLLCAWVLPCRAADQSNAERIAASVARYLDEQAVIVAHLDLASLDVNAAVTSVKTLLGENAAAGIGPVSKIVQGLKEAGATEACYLVSVEDIPRFPGMIAVPLPDGVNRAGIRAILESVPMNSNCRVEEIDRALISAAPETLERVKSLKAVARPHLSDAFAALGGAPLQIVFTPPDYFRPVIEQTLPELPEVIGGGPSTILTEGALWLAAGIEFAPEARIRVVAQSESPQAAQALQKKFGEACDLLRKHEKMRADVPEIDQVMPLLAPEVENDRLVLTVSVENGRLPGLIRALLPK